MFIQRHNNYLEEKYQLPDDLLSSLLAPSPKNAKKCEEYRTISLMSQVLTIISFIVHNRLKSKCNNQLRDTKIYVRLVYGHQRSSVFCTDLGKNACRIASSTLSTLTRPLFEYCTTNLSRYFAILCSIIETLTLYSPCTGIKVLLSSRWRGD